MRALALKFPPLALTGLALLTVVGAHQLAPRACVASLWSQVAGVLLGLAGLTFLFGAALQFRRSKTTLDPHNPEKAAVFVASGLYRFTRNPMYLGMAMVVTAVSFWLTSLMGFVVVAVLCAYLTTFQIKPEEQAMLRQFGAQYAQYMKRVRRWL